MSKDKIIRPVILPGFMELLPNEQLAFNKMLNIIKESYELFGFVPLDTPIIEKADVLLAKAGSEATLQTYKFKKGSTSQALRFDLTVPLARYVSQHFHELTFPFRRYQIGKVYRGEKPQKGRFREFYQCDVDIIGHNELDYSNDAEILAVTYFTFKRLDLGKFVIKLNNRKILSGYLEDLGIESKITAVMRLIDKLDKIGADVFMEELKKLSLSKEQISILEEILTIKKDSASIIKHLKDLNLKNEKFVKGLAELEEVVKIVKLYQIPEEFWQIDLSIARGLDYYTSTVFETFLEDYLDLGSVCSGGRYDNLAAYYTNEKLPGVGISLGLTRLFDQVNEINLINTHRSTPTKILLVSLTGSLSEIFNFATNLRNNMIAAQVYEQKDSLSKMLEYANKIGVPYVGILGEDELRDSKITVKNMSSGEQELVDQNNLVEYFKKKL